MNDRGTSSRAATDRKTTDRQTTGRKTTGHGTIGRHDVVDAQSEYLGLAPHEPGDFAIVPDAAHPEIPEAGWIVGFVHDPSGDEADLRVIDAADLRQPALATVRIPRPANRGLRCAWLPSTRH